MPRPLRALAALTLPASFVAATAANAAPSPPCGTNGVRTIAASTITCTYTQGGVDDTFTVPAGITRISVVAIGARGGGPYGGQGAIVRNPSLPVASGTTLYALVGTPGRRAQDASGTVCAPLTTRGLPDGGPAALETQPDGTCGATLDAVPSVGGGGGSSALSTAARNAASLTGFPATDSRLLVAAGGGGSGAFTFRPGGSAGSGSVLGAAPGQAAFADSVPTSGLGPTDGTNGGGAAGWRNDAPDGAGTAARGGAGFWATSPTSSTQGGAGGGGGWFGGGGGGAVAGGGSWSAGAGSSYLGADPTAGATITTATSSDAPVLQISYDATSPTATISTPADGQTYLLGASVATAFSCSAGTASITSCTDSEGDTSSPGALDTSTTGPHTYSVTAQASDGLSDTATISYTVVADTAAPTTTDSVDATWRQSPITVTLNAIDATSGGLASGVDTTTYEILDPAGTPGPTQTYDPAQKPVLSDGESIRYRSIDRSGNREDDQTSMKARVDAIAPTTTDDVAAAPAATPRVVTLTATDTGGSGVATTTYEIIAAGGSPGSTQTYDAANKPQLAAGESIRYRSVDGAGNAETDRSSSTVIAPTPTPTPTPTPMPTPTPTPTPTPSPTPAATLAPSPAPTSAPLTQTEPTSRVRLRLELFGPQIWLSKNYVLVRVGCGPVACRLQVNGALWATGKRRVSLRPRIVRLAARELRIVRLRTTRTERRTVRRIVGPGGTSGEARFKLTATELPAAGAATTGSFTVPLRALER